MRQKRMFDGESLCPARLEQGLQIDGVAIIVAGGFWKIRWRIAGDDDEVCDGFGVSLLCGAQPTGFMQRMRIGHRFNL